MQPSPLLASLLAIVVGALMGQFPRLPKIPEDLSKKIPSTESILKGTRPITTNLNDAIGDLPFLDAYAPRVQHSMLELQRSPRGGFIPRPGLYELGVQSYCLHAGTYAPGKGNGYVYAPVAGPRAAVVCSILRNSVDHPEIQQRDIQVLLWAIIARTKVQDLSRHIQLVAAQLLTPPEILDINGGAVGMISESVQQRVIANMPPAARSVLEAEGRLRRMLTEATVSYSELESAAVLFGEAPRGEGTRDVPRGRWCYHPDGYFVRYLPSSYPHTVIQVYFPEPFTIIRDQFGCVTAIIDPQGNRTEVEYDETIEPLSVPGEAGLRGYAFKTIRFVRPYTSKPRVAERVEYKGVGWTFARTASPSTEGSIKLPGRYEGWQKRYNQSKQQMADFESFKRQWSKARGSWGWSDFDLMVNLIHFQQALEAAVGSVSSAKPAWLAGHLERGYNACQYAFCRAEGSCGASPSATAFPAAPLLASTSPRTFLFPPNNDVSQGPWLLLAGGTPAPGALRFAAAAGEAYTIGGAGAQPRELPDFVPSKQVATPGNTANQLLAQSEQPSDLPCDQIALLEQIIKDKEKTRDLFDQFKDTAKDCDDLAKKVNEGLSKDCPDCKITEGGSFDPTGEGPPKVACEDQCKNYPRPVCEWLNSGCQDHEGQHAADWKACVEWPSGCAREQENMTNYCAQREIRAYNKELETLRNYLANLKKGCGK
jgi:hypothetical protein